MAVLEVVASAQHRELWALAQLAEQLGKQHDGYRPCLERGMLAYQVCRIGPPFAHSPSLHVQLIRIV